MLKSPLASKELVAMGVQRSGKGAARLVEVSTMNLVLAKPFVPVSTRLPASSLALVMVTPVVGGGAVLLMTSCTDVPSALFWRLAVAPVGSVPRTKSYPVIGTSDWTSTL